MMERVARWTIFKLFFKENTVSFEESSDSEDGPTATENPRIRRCFYRHFSIDTGFALDISATSGRCFPDLGTWLIFSAFCIWKEKGGKYVEIAFSLLVSPTFLFLKSTSFLISLFCCAGRYSCLLSTFRWGSLVHTFIRIHFRTFYFV